MPDQPLVSVLMTAYNREKYIAQAIESVLASTFQDFELIIVDDGSTDATVEIARRYVSDPRVQVHVNPKNLGDYPNRNHAAEMARGKYLKYVDSDDYLYPHGLAVMMACMEHFPNAGLGLSRPAIADQPYPVQLTPLEAYREHFFESVFLANAPLSAIIKHAAFRAVGGFSGTPYIGDSELWLKLAARYPVVKLPRDLAWWRLHVGQEFQQGQRDYPLLIFQMMREALNDSACPLSHEEAAVALRRLRQHYARVIMSSLAHGHIGRALQLYRAIRPSLFDMWRGLRRLSPSRSYGVSAEAHKN